MLIDLLSIVTVQLLSLITLSHTYHLCVVPWNESAKTGYQFEGEACIKFQIQQIFKIIQLMGMTSMIPITYQCVYCIAGENFICEITCNLTNSTYIHSMWYCTFHLFSRATLWYQFCLFPQNVFSLYSVAMQWFYHLRDYSSLLVQLPAFRCLNMFCMYLSKQTMQNPNHNPLSHCSGGVIVGT